MASRPRVTITDIAKAANVSIATVSRILNNRGGRIKISEGTKARVLGIADQLGYEANPFATSLRSGRSGVVGAIVREIADPFLTELTRAVERCTWEMGWNIFVAHAQFDDSMLRRHVSAMVNGLFDGLILIGSLVEAHDLLSKVQAREIPAVSISAGDTGSIPSVELDNARAARLAIEHLLELGHRRIAFLGSIEIPGVAIRLQSMREELQRRRVPLPAELVLPTPNDRGRAIEGATSLLRPSSRPTAVLCSSDNLALGVVTAARKMGLRVPQDVSIIGFDDVQEAGLSHPALTTVRQPIAQMAKQAVRALHRRIEGGQRARGMTMVEPELVVRETTARPPP